MSMKWAVSWLNVIVSLMSSVVRDSTTFTTSAETTVNSLSLSLSIAGSVQTADESGRYLGFVPGGVGAQARCVLTPPGTKPTCRPLPYRCETHITSHSHSSLCGTLLLWLGGGAVGKDPDEAVLEASHWVQPEQPGSGVPPPKVVAPPRGGVPSPRCVRHAISFRNGAVRYWSGCLCYVKSWFAAARRLADGQQ